MSEKLYNTNIQVDKTPEEIAQELEKKAKELEASWKKAEAERKIALAKKVRAIESSTVTGTTEVKLKNLQSSLGELEKKDFEEAKKAPVIKDNEDSKNTSKTIVAWAWLTTAAKAVSDKIDESWLWKLGLKDAIKEWITEAIENKPEEWSGFFEKFIYKFKMVFLTPFALAFWVDLKWLKGKDDKWNEQANNWQEQKQENWIDHKFIIASNLFAKIYWKQFGKDFSKDLSSIFAIDNFRNKKFSELRPIYDKYQKSNSKEWIGKELWIIGFSDENIFNSLSAIMASNSDGYKLINNVYIKKNESIEEKTIEEILSWIYSNLNLMVNFDKINSFDDIISWKAWDFFDLHATNNDKWEIEITWWLYEKANSMWLSKNLIFFLFWRSNFNINQFSDPNFINSISTKELDAEDKKILTEKIIPFGQSIWNVINSKFNLWIDLNAFFQTNPLSLNQILSMYIITWWTSDYEKMNSLEKTYLFVKTIQILSEKDKKIWAQYFARITEKMQDNISIPEEVKDILWNIGNSFKDSIIEWLSDTWKWLHWFTKERPVVAWIIVLIILFTPIANRKTTIFNIIRNK